MSFTPNRTVQAGLFFPGRKGAVMKQAVANLFLTAFFFAAPPAFGAPWYKISSGIHYKTIELNRGDSLHPYVIHVFKIDPTTHELRPMLAKTPTSVRKMAEVLGARIAVNANFFGTDGKPLGLVVGKGKILNPFKKISWWGVFFMEQSRPRIVHSSEYHPHQHITTAVQAGPRLVIRGRIPRLKSEAGPKTAIGINKKGEIILLASHYPIQTREIALVMARSEKKGGLGCVDALNLDGGSSTQMYAKINPFELKLPSYVGVPVGLGVFKKEK